VVVQGDEGREEKYFIPKGWFAGEEKRDWFGGKFKWEKRGGKAGVKRNLRHVKR